MSKVAAALITFSCLLFSPALADDPPRPEVRALIERQFDALAHDDADAAYKLAAPGLQSVFTDPRLFLAMVRSKYAPVYRHRSADFGPYVDSGSVIEQAVFLIDGENNVWTAIYRLARQPDGSWKIGGCVLMRSEQTSI